MVLTVFLFSYVAGLALKKVADMAAAEEALFLILVMLSSICHIIAMSCVVASFLQLIGWVVTGKMIFGW